MKKISLLTVFIFLVFFSFSASAGPLFKIKKPAQVLNIGSGGSATIQVDVFVPKGQHIYLKNLNAMSFNNETKFDIPPGYGFGVAIETRPPGIKKDQDLILKGKGTRYKAGTYTLKIFETKGRVPSAKVYKLRIKVRSQACNTSSNMCYKPQIKYVYLKATINKPKLRSSFSARSISPVKWITSYDKAFAKARKTGQNVFVVITAPTWCGYCVVLERKVFSKSAVGKVLNKKFVPLRILDTNSDKRKFTFRGYPTMIMLNHDGKELTRSIPRSESGFLSVLSRYEKSPGTSNNNNKPDKDINTDKDSSSEQYSYSVQTKGTFYQKGDIWYQKSSDGRIVDRFKAQKRGSSYLILKSLINNQYVALPVKGNRGFRFINKKWVPVFTVQKK